VGRGPGRFVEVDDAELAEGVDVAVVGRAAKGHQKS
jgi:hypothetical protein